MKFILEFNIENYGWASALLQSEGQIYNIASISYLSDAFNSLSRAILDLLRGCKAAECTFDHEPGRTKLRFIRHVDNVKITAYRFEKTLEDVSWDSGNLEFECSTSIKRLKSQYLAAADNIRRKYADTEYAQEWRHPFPTEIYESIKNI